MLTNKQIHNDSLLILLLISPILSPNLAKKRKINSFSLFSFLEKTLPLLVMSKMASKKARKPNRAEKKLKRTHFKKQLPQHKNTDTATILDHTSSSSIVSSCSSTTTSFFHEDTNYSAPSPSPAVLTSSPGEGGSAGCCTPKARKARIPEMLSCPPAPKKQRVAQNCVLRRRQIVFFAPPEIELFFVKAHDR